MNEKRYIISDASKVLDVESHVLRYWEEELEIQIPRNEMGHRYYTENHINLLKNVRDLKRQGYGLRTIRMMIGGTPKELPESTVQNSKMEQFQEIMGNIMIKALRESGQILGREIGEEIKKEMGEHIVGSISKDVSSQVSENVIKEINYNMRLMEQKEEERYKKLDEMIRMRQKKAKTKKKREKKAKENKKIIVFRKEKQPQTT